jgi:hypothetical protein
MSALKEFLNPQIFINSLVFSLPVSLLVLLRASFIGDVELFSIDALQLYLALALILSILFIFIFFILFLLARRKPEDD